MSAAANAVSGMVDSPVRSAEHTVSRRGRYPRSCCADSLKRASGWTYVALAKLFLIMDVVLSRKPGRGRSSTK